MANKVKKTKSKRIFSWMNPKLESRETSGYGKGVYTKKDIKKNEVVAVFGGYIMDAKDESGLPGNLSDYSLQIGDNLVIGPAKFDEVSDSEAFNHSCDPNVGFHGQIFLVAMRDILKNEQICFDYAMVLSRSKGVKAYKIKCLCGSDKCRGYITDNEWRSPELQKRYRGYFQWYLQEKINNKIKK